MQSDKTLFTQNYFLLTVDGKFPYGDYVASQQRQRSMRRNSKTNQHFLNREISKV